MSLACQLFIGRPAFYIKETRGKHGFFQRNVGNLRQKLFLQVTFPPLSFSLKLSADFRNRLGKGRAKAKIGRWLHKNGRLVLQSFPIFITGKVEDTTVYPVFLTLAVFSFLFQLLDAVIGHILFVQIVTPGFIEKDTGIVCAFLVHGHHHQTGIIGNIDFSPGKNEAWADLSLSQIFFRDNAQKT